MRVKSEKLEWNECFLALCGQTNVHFFFIKGTLFLFGTKWQDDTQNYILESDEEDCIMQRMSIFASATEM